MVSDRGIGHSALSMPPLDASVCCGKKLMSRSEYRAKRWQRFVGCAVAYAFTINVALIALLGAQAAAASSGKPLGRFEICQSRGTNNGPGAPSHSQDHNVQCIAFCTASIQLLTTFQHSFVSVRLPPSWGISYSCENCCGAVYRIRDPARPPTGPPSVA